MEFRKMTAEEAAALIQNGQTIGLSHVAQIEV